MEVPLLREQRRLVRSVQSEGLDCPVDAGCYRYRYINKEACWFRRLTSHTNSRFVHTTYVSFAAGLVRVVSLIQKPRCEKRVRRYLPARVLDECFNDEIARRIDKDNLQL